MIHRLRSSKLKSQTEVTMNNIDTDSARFDTDFLDWTKGYALEMGDLNGRKVSVGKDAGSKMVYQLLKQADLVAKSLREFGTVGGSATAKTDRDGNSEIEIKGHVDEETPDGGTISGEISVSGKIDRDGKPSSEVKAEIKFERPFIG
jgi:hypothetical protein